MFGKNPKIDAVAAVVAQVLQAEAKLSPKQKKEIDKNHNGKIDGQDFAILRGMKKEEVTTDTTKGREKGSMSCYTPEKVTLKGDVEKRPDPKKPEETAARKSIEAKGVKTEETVQEVSPPGWSGTVKAMKKHKNIDNPFALAWSMKKKGDKPHYKPEKKNEEVEIDEGLKDVAKKAFKSLTGGSDKDHLDRLKKDMYGGSEVKYAAKTLVKHAKDPLGLKKEETETVEEGWDDMVKDAKEKVKSGPQPNGGSGKKQGSAYGGSKQKDKPEHDVKEGWEGSAKDSAEDKKEAKKRHMSMKEWEKSAADKKHDMKEAKTLSPGQDDAPFDAPTGTTPKNIKDKSGAVHTPMSRARNLARAALSKIKQDQKLG